MFEDIKERLKIRGFTDIQHAAMFYVQIKISYGSDTRTFGCNRKNLSPDYLEKVEKRLEKIVIENKDFENLIKVYDCPEALFYCDPPYHKTENYYDAVFSKDDNERLKAALSQIKGRFILSYNDDEYIREPYCDFEIISVELQNNLFNGILRAFFYILKSCCFLLIVNFFFRFLYFV